MFVFFRTNKTAWFVEHDGGNLSRDYAPSIDFHMVVFADTCGRSFTNLAVDDDFASQDELITSSAGAYAARG